MKRIVTLLFSLILVLSLPLSIAFGESGSYSPGQPPIDTPTEPEEKGEEYLEPIDITLATTQEGYAVVYDDKDEPTEWVKIIITPVADRFVTEYEDIEMMLDRAYKQVLGMESVTELTKELEPYISEEKELVISDLFDVSVKGSDEEVVMSYLANSGYTVRFKVRIPIKDGEFWLPLHNYDGTKWEIVEDRSVDNDIITLRVDSLSPFAIVRESINGEDEPEGDHCMCECTGILPCCLCWLKGFIVGVVITAIICLIVISIIDRKARKEREKREELEEELEKKEKEENI